MIFVLTGSGISAESGLQTFRGAGGRWRQWDIAEVATAEAWRRHPQRVWEFYSARRDEARGALPNAAHLALAQSRAGMVICTQNVDSLHEAAGSANVLHFHGRLFWSRCERCGHEFPDDRIYAEPPVCERCDGLVRPDICLFGEVPFHLEESARLAAQCDLFLAIGTSGAVYPAAGLVHYAPGPKVYIGLERPENAGDYDAVHLGKATALVPEFLATAQTFRYDAHGATRIRKE